MKRIIPLMLVVLAACGDSHLTLESTNAGHGDDGALALEAGEISAALDSAGVAAPHAYPEPFVRMGLFWEGGDGAAIELRTRIAGAEWSDWAQPTRVFDEDGLRAGHVDAAPGSTEFQFRLRRDLAAPHFVSFDPIENLGGADPTDALPAPDEGESLTDPLLPEGVTQQELAANPEIKGRKAWNAKPPRCRSAMSPFRATIHHTVSPNNDSLTTPQRLRAIQAFHMGSENMCDIAYNYLISGDGTIWVGRGRLSEGGHTFNENGGNVGIAFIGNFMERKPTDKQLCQVGRLLAFLHRKHDAIKLERSDVKGHRQYGAQFGSTACPGDKVYSRIDDILRLARNGCH